MTDLIRVEPKGIEEVRVFIGEDLEFVLCNHGAHLLARLLTEVAKGQYCDGYRHGEPETVISYITVKTKRLTELRPGDIPHGLNPEDVAVDG